MVCSFNILYLKTETTVLNVHNLNTNMNTVCSFNIMHFKTKTIVLNVHNLNANIIHNNIGYTVKELS